MAESLNKLFPNIVPLWSEFLKAVYETVLMVVWSGLISFILGLAIGIVLIVTKKGGLLENLSVYQILDKIINFLRSIPFIILLTWVIPLSRLFMGTSIGIEGAIVPLIIGVTPFFSRQVEAALSEIDWGLIEAANAMGTHPVDIILGIYLKESISALSRATTITIITLINLTAMAGVVGAGGLGDFAIRYGHDRNMSDITWVTVFTVFVMVSIVQVVGNWVAKTNRH
ncbi:MULTISPECIES: methionine ABC transporter permease [Streptococcus]|uniref:methionine ABC transporter permease n=1 Tax=Streptococcus TaxID=1301 RepID=UPI0034583B46